MTQLRKKARSNFFESDFASKTQRTFSSDLTHFLCVWMMKAYILKKRFWEYIPSNLMLFFERKKSRYLYFKCVKTKKKLKIKKFVKTKIRNRIPATPWWIRYRAMIDDNKKEPIDCQFNEKTAAQQFLGTIQILWSQLLCIIVLKSSWEFHLKLSIWHKKAPMKKIIGRCDFRWISS